MTGRYAGNFNAWGDGQRRMSSVMVSRDTTVLDPSTEVDRADHGPLAEYGARVEAGRLRDDEHQRSELPSELR